MFSSKVFNRELYLAHVHEVTTKYRLPWNSNVDKSASPGPFTGTITDEWLEPEIAKAYKRDEADPYYTGNPVNNDALEDVASTPEGSYIIVLTGDNRFFGKIRLWRNDADYTLNVMYLYVSGDNRRARTARQATVVPPDEKQPIVSAGIMWYFAAQLSQELYGMLARVIIVYPREPIYKYLVRYGAVFVSLERRRELIDARISSGNSLETHGRIKRAILVVLGDVDAQIGDGTEGCGALFAAPFLVQQLG